MIHMSIFQKLWFSGGTRSKDQNLPDLIISWIFSANVIDHKILGLVCCTFNYDPY